MAENTEEDNIQDYENETTTYEHLILQNIDDAIYEDLQTKTKREKHLYENLQSDKIRRYKRFGVGVGLLCAVVLALLNVAVPLYLYQTNMVEREGRVTSYNQLLDRTYNLTEKIDQLLTRIHNLTVERDQLLTRINNLTVERDQLLTSTNNLTVEGEELLTRLDLLQARCNLTEQDAKRIFCESDGFTFCGGLCYYISNETKTWEESRQWCRDNQSDLIVINSTAKQDLVAGLHQRVWLGLTASEKKGPFQWVDGTPLNTTPTYWGPGQPNYNGLCVEYNIKGRGWNDMPCSTQDQWICERV